MNNNNTKNNKNNNNINKINNSNALQLLLFICNFVCILTWCLLSFFDPPGGNETIIQQKRQIIQEYTIMAA